MKSTLPPIQNVVNPEAIITGVVGIGFTATVNLKLFPTHPSAEGVTI